MAYIKRDNERIFELLNSLIGWFSDNFDLSNYLGKETGLNVSDKNVLQNFSCYLNESLDDVVASFSDDQIEKILHVVINEYIASTKYYHEKDEEFEEEFSDLINSYKEDSYKPCYF